MHVTLNQEIIFAHLVNLILFAVGITVPKTEDALNFCMTMSVAVAVEISSKPNKNVNQHASFSAP